MFYIFFSIYKIKRMEELKLDFSIDCLTGQKIPLDEYRNKIKQVIKRKSGIYVSEIANLYYKETYNKNILEVLSLKYEIPICPITNEFVSFTLRGSIFFGKFSTNCTPSQITHYSLENNEEYKKKIESFKTIRKGAGNPMFEKDAWNKGKTKEDNLIMKKISEDRLGLVMSEEVKKKQSESAKKREIHGHTGIKHSEESKQVMREKTIARFKKGEFPQTNSLPHRIVKEILKSIFGECGVGFFEEQEKYGFVFDFMVNNFLIEVQGDYFHCNPNTRHAKPKNKMQENNLKRDIRKKDAVEKGGEYIFVELWENDIINNKEKIILCLKNLKK